jgi:5-methyltetrahydrofolate--homocysteine methyltransferase
VHDELGVNTVCGASNISFGLPDRPTLNSTFLAMAIASGMNCAITNPLEENIRKTILAANVLMGVDENCQAWLSAQRQAGAEAGEEGGRRRRRMRREAR